MLELAVLGLLHEQPLHGYALRKLLTQRLGAFWRVSFGSLYPTLRKLERAGFIERSRVEGPGRRRRQVYRITDVGREQFMALLEGDAESVEEERFPLRLAFFRHLRPESRIRVLERRRAELVQRHAERSAELERVAHDPFADGYVVSLMRHGVARIDADLEWLDGLIAAERGLAGERDAEHVDED